LVCKLPLPPAHHTAATERTPPTFGVLPPLHYLHCHRTRAALLQFAPPSSSWRTVHYVLHHTVDSHHTLTLSPPFPCPILPHTYHHTAFLPPPTCTRDRCPWGWTATRHHTAHTHLQEPTHRWTFHTTGPRTLFPHWIPHFTHCTPLPLSSHHPKAASCAITQLLPFGTHPLMPRQFPPHTPSCHAHAPPPLPLLCPTLPPPHPLSPGKSLPPPTPHIHSHPHTHTRGAPTTPHHAHTLSCLPYPPPPPGWLFNLHLFVLTAC